MKKRVLCITNVIATLIVVCFFLSVCYRQAFPAGEHDRQISIAEVFLIFPVVASGLWLLARALRKDRSQTWFYQFVSWLAQGGSSRRWLATLVGAALLIGGINLISLIMRTAL